MPRVSIVVLNYNYGRFLGDCLDSIAAQTFRDFEVILADDGSTDGSLDVARGFEGRLPLRVLTGPNLGVAGNMLRGLAATAGDVLAVTSADDRWLPEHLEIGLRALDEHPEAGLSYSQISVIDADGAPVVAPPSAKRPYVPTGRIDPLELLPHQFITTQAALIRREAYEQAGALDPEIHYLELDLLVRIVERYPVAYTGRTTVEYRRHGSGMSLDHQKALDARLQLYDKYFKPEQAALKAQFAAVAIWRAAFRELVDDPDRAAMRRARANAFAAIRARPSSALSRMHALTALITLLGPAFPPVQRFYVRRLRDSELKVRLQRLLGMGSARRAKLPVPERES